MNRVFSILAFALLVAGAYSAVLDPDLPGFAPNIKRIYSCSIVIPMDDKQITDASFNMKSYGLVAHLLWQDIPVNWMIKTGKNREDVDFWALSWQYYPIDQKERGDPPVNRSFSGGPFVIETQYTPFAAPEIVNYTRTRTPVNLYKLAETIMADVRYEMKKKPKVAILDTSSQNIVQRKVLELSGFEQFDIYTAAQANNLSAGTCITIATEPHLTANNNNGKVLATSMRTFLESGGNFLAQCGGITSYENCGISNNPTVDECPNGRYLATRGLRSNSGDHDSPESSNCNVVGRPTCVDNYTYPAGDTPISQFMGKWQYYFGLVTAFSLQNSTIDGGTFSSTLRSDTGAHPVVQYLDPRTQHRRNLYLNLHGKLPQFHGALGGNVFYLAGHRYFDVLKDVSATNCPRTPPSSTFQCQPPGGQQYCVGGDHDCAPIVHNYSPTQCANLSNTYWPGTSYACEYGKGADLQPGRRFYMNAILHPADRDPACKFDVDACKWGVCGFLKKRAYEEHMEYFIKMKKRGVNEIVQTPNTTIPSIQCNCTHFFDCVGNCGGEGTPAGLCNLVTPGSQTGIATGSLTGVPTVTQPPWPNTPTPTGGSGSTPTQSPPPVPTPTLVVPTPNSPGTSENPLDITDKTDPSSTNSNSITATLAPGAWHYYLVNRGENVLDIWAYIQVLSPSGSVSFYINQRTPPEEGAANCAVKNIGSSLDWSYNGELSSGANSCSLPTSNLVSPWIIAIANDSPSASVTYSLEVLLENIPPSTKDPLATSGTWTQVSLVISFILGMIIWF